MISNNIEKKRHPLLREYTSEVILFLTDLTIMYIVLIFSYYLCLDIHIYNSFNNFELIVLPVSIVTFILMYEGIYNYRYDFWQETKIILKSLFISFFIIITLSVIVKIDNDYPVKLIILSFLSLSFLLPITKFFLKTKLFKLGFWKKGVKVHSNGSLNESEIFDNPYLGYIKSKRKKADLIFIDSNSYEPKILKQKIEEEIRLKDKVLFIPIINNYQFSNSDLYELTNSRKNLIVLQNKLNSKLRATVKTTANFLLAIMLLPILLPIILILSILIKKESPGPVFFAHKRVGKNGKIIGTLKFRSMYKDAKERLDKLLEEDPLIKKEWEKNFKLKNDPRVTKIGAFLRKTSLDELPQIFNVLKGEMNFVGPRPVVQEELDKYYKEDKKYYSMVKPGITGLWQVSGRSETDYEFRVDTDKWYVVNWSLWLDIVILFKTVKVVLKKEGAY